jgi:hypothetical protein
MVGLSKQGFKISLSNFIDAQAALGSPLHVVYDKSLTDVTNVDSSVTEWISVNFGNIDFSGIFEAQVDLYVLTREDPEGLANSAVFDRVLNFFSDPVMPDGNKRIPFYELRNGVLVQTSTMWLARITPLREFTLLDETKVCPTQLYLSWNGTL